MSIMENQALDMAAILNRAYEVGDLINSSVEVAEYHHWKLQLESSAEVQQMIAKFEKTKERFEECQRFGHFHPDYHSALEEVNLIQQNLAQFESVINFKLAEENLDDLLFKVSQTIALSVSETIKVPSNQLLPSGGGCGSGGGCSGKCS
ncbi:MAG TPA: YlbF family regulator [Bacilli bacterium]